MSVASGRLRIGLFGLVTTLVVLTSALVVAWLIYHRQWFEQRMTAIWSTAALALLITVGYATFYCAVLGQREKLRPAAGTVRCRYALDPVRNGSEARPRRDSESVS